MTANSFLQRAGALSMIIIVALVTLPGCNQAVTDARIKLLGQWEIEKKLLKETIIAWIQEENGDIDEERLVDLYGKADAARIELEFRDDGSLTFETQLDIEDNASIIERNGTWEILSVINEKAELKIWKGGREFNTTVIFIRKDLIEITGFIPDIPDMPEVRSNVPSRFNRKL